MKSNRSSRAVERILHATDSASVSGNLSAEEKIKWLEAQNMLLRFHAGCSIKDACRIAGIPRCAYYRALKPTAKSVSDAELVRLMCDIENDRHISSFNPLTPRQPVL